VLNRARKSRPRHPRSEGAPTFVARSGEDLDFLDRLAGLPERQRLVVFLRYFADLSYQEIATVVGVRVGTVSATLHAAHDALRAELEEVQG
jgi:RNA polymerase sigma factor (sigma-70 family)